MHRAPRIGAVALAAAALLAAPVAAQISLVKTVGTTPAVCATTDAISVPVGTTVYYCYQATNTGTTTYTLHGLIDSALGPLFANTALSLPPAATTPPQIFAATPAATVTNTATWTALVAPTVTTFSWIDITSSGTALGLADDGEANVVLPWSFTLFGVSSTNLRIGNNGGILFNATTGDLSTANAAIPAATPALAILPFWDDIDSDTGDVYWATLGSAPNRQFVVEWYNRPHYSNVGSATFEVIFDEASGAIVFQYLDVDFGNASYDNGASATVGLNQNANSALSWSFNQAVITANLAIAFPSTALATATDTATVTVLQPNIAVSPLAVTSTQGPNQTVNQTLDVGNTGQAPLTWTIDETVPLTVPAGPAAPPAPAKVQPVVGSEKDCELYANYAGREPRGWSEFCASPNGGATAPAGVHAPTSTGFAVDVRNDRFVQFTLNNFPGQTTVGTLADAIYGVDFDAAGTTLYALNDATDQLGTINLATGAFTSIVACPAPAAGTWTGLTIDPVTNVFWASTATDLYTLNPATCSPTLVGPFGVASGIMIDIAINGAGQMYGHEIATDSIYTINTATGAATLVGPTGYAANFAQGMDFDNEDGTLYIFLYVGTGVNHFGTVNLATGAVTPLASSNPLGEFEGATQTIASCNPTNYPWLTVAPASGTTAPASSTPVTLGFDSTGQACGASLTGQVCVRSNDPDGGTGNGTSLVPVDVTLNVQCVSSLTLALTVGTTAGVCAPAGGLEVPPGTTVYPCYTVTNTGNFTLTLHDLTDSQLGPIFTGLAYSLAPGASVTSIAAGFNPGFAVNAPTTFSGTWTAYNAGAANQASAQAAITVTVRQSALEIPTLAPAGLAGLVLLLAGGAVVMLRRRRSP